MKRSAGAGRALEEERGAERIARLPPRPRPSHPAAAQDVLSLRSPPTAPALTFSQLPSSTPAAPHAGTLLNPFPPAPRTRN